MLCSTCQRSARRYGQNRNGSKRYHCDACRRSFTDASTRPSDGRRLDPEKAIQALRLILEGNSVRSTERLLGIGKKTILSLVVLVGEGCKRFLEESIVGVPVRDIQCDELWSWIHCKEKTRLKRGYSEEFGDCFVFTALDRETKLMLAWHMGKRDNESTVEFVRKLRRAVYGDFQISTDGFPPYKSAMPLVFGYRQDFAQIVKIFGKPVDGEARYSPAQIIDCHVNKVTGDPDIDRACTSHVERSNLTVRMQIRRFTRLTNGFSKLPRNHEAAIALFFAYYNFCRVHMTLKCTPAMAAGLSDHAWSVKELIQRVIAQDTSAVAS